MNETPPKPEPWKGVVLILTLINTVFAALLSGLQVDAGIRANNANRDSQYYAALASSELVRQGHQSSYDFQTLAIIHDPARGRVECTLAELSNHFTGVALEVFPGSSFATIEARIPVNVGSLWSKLTGLGQSLLLVMTLSIALQVAAFAMPFQMQFVLDEAIGQNNDNLLLIIALGFGGLASLQAVITALRDWSVQLLGSQMVFQMVGNLMRHLIRLPSSYFEKRHVGDILSRMQSTKAVQDALTQGVVTAVIDGLMALVAGIVLFVYAPQLAGLVFLSVILLLGATGLF